MNRYHVSTGEVNTYVLASSPREAAIVAIHEAKPGTKFGTLTQVGEYEEDPDPLFFSTKLLGEIFA